ncbi:MAG: ATP-binding cassette domain-containing protein, partial [Paracoccaceae bacterium]
VFLGLVPVFAALVLDVAHARTIAGYRSAREVWAGKARAGVAAFICLILTFVHPLLGAGIVTAGVAAVAFHAALQQLGRRERLWDFNAAEAVSILAGRDAKGFSLASAEQTEHAVAHFSVQVLPWLGVMVTMAGSSWLIVREVLAPATLPAAALVTLWASEALVAEIRRSFGRSASGSLAEARVEQLAEDPDSAVFDGLVVAGISARAADKTPLLSDVALLVNPGRIAVVGGESGAGKSLLLRAIADPFALDELNLCGRATLNGYDLWHRRARETAVPAAFVGHEPLLLPASGADNLSCFHDHTALDRGKRILETLLFSTHAVNQTCAAPNANLLPAGRKRALALARAFLLAPSLYLLDRPEDGLTEKQVVALCDRLKQEARMGRCILMITENRLLNDLADDLILLQDGRVVDFGAAADIRKGMLSGWARFVGARHVDTLDNLERWIRSHFLRNGDEGNRRKVAQAAGELLALSCQGLSEMETENLRFEFKHFEGHCILRLIDDGTAISSALIQQAENLKAESPSGRSRLPPLAVVMRECDGFETGVEDGRRVVELRIKTYDPRKSAAREVGSDVAIR